MRTKATRRGELIRPGGGAQPRQRILRAGLALVAMLAASAVVIPAAQGASGDLDPSFASNGILQEDLGWLVVAGGVAVQPDDDIVVTGKVIRNHHARLLVARVQPDGTLDPGFSGDGKVVINLPGRRDFADDVAIQPDGKIVVGGYTRRVNRYPKDFRMTVVRFLPNGRLDRLFGTEGMQFVQFPGLHSSSKATSVAIAPGDKIVVAGSAESDGDPGGHFAVAQLTADGSLDPTFSGDGRAKISFGPTVVGDEANGVVIDGSGRIVVAGTVSFTGDSGVARLLPDGSLDDTFSGDGVEIISAGESAYWDGYAVAVDEEDGVLVAGSDGGDFGLARLDSSGAPDGTFGNAGRQTTDFGAYDQANGIAIANDGKILLAGATYAGDEGLAVARYLPGGSPDPSFSEDGKLVTPVGPYRSAVDLALDSQQRIVVLGSPGYLTLARYLP